MKITDTKRNKTVVVGMSGGVDSSVAALLLKKQGYNVVGMFMKNWDELDDSGSCLAASDYEDVIAVCDKIEIPYYTVDFVKEYRDLVFTHFVEEYKQGFTPNPDILCNKEIKFNVFLKYAKEMGADYLATGHYCINGVDNGVNILKKGQDPGKDQSYFLYTIKEDILEHILFPIGNMLKKEVRDIAQKYDLPTKDKKDSTGICFIGERNFRKFLSDYLPPKKGVFETLEGEFVGTHNGAQFYTIGQRKGLGLGGPGAPWFVVDKDIEINKIFVCRGINHPALYCDNLTAVDPSWVGKKMPFKLPHKLKAKIRYRQKDQDCTILKDEGGRLFIEFSSPQRAIAPRQSIVFYHDDICLGGAIIESSGLSYYKLGKDLKI